MKHFALFSLAFGITVLGVSNASATTVDFNGLASVSVNTPILTYSEYGATLTMSDGNFRPGTNGNPGADLRSIGSLPNSFTLTDGGLFYFSSIDLADLSDSTTSHFTITGFNGATQVFTDSGSLGPDSGYFTESFGTSSMGITSLKVTLTGYETQIDNINLATPFNSASVASTPEPSSLILLGTGLTGLAGAVRRRFKK